MVVHVIVMKILRGSIASSIAVFLRPGPCSYQDISKLFTCPVVVCTANETLTMSNSSKILSLTKKRDALVSELQKLEATIVAAFTGSAKPAATGAKRGPKPGRKAAAVKAAPAKKAPAAKAAAPEKRGKRGALKEQIIATLKAAGSKGIGVKEISSKLGVKAANVHVWFGTTGKTVGVEKVSPGVYRLK